MKTVFATIAVLMLAACGYKGDLYLPKEGDKARFGVIQTGLGNSNTGNTNNSDTSNTNNTTQEQAQ